ncbi:chaperonin 10-like protein [Exophiala viscosa]|uniref:chaperonin 10-like protein n=1 Tax=Exophiala viscosa TaxID=2486360 RepID=UPI00218F3F8C|nr:chaperonin 10-like protein [Exophiala viscosa]
MSHQAAWIKEQHADLVVDKAPTPTPGPGELLVKVKVIGFSPLEAKIQKQGMIPIPYPNVLGMSFSGIVESVGPDVSEFKPGDEVAVVRDGPKGGEPRFGAYQQYALASQTSTSKLPDGVTLESGATSILNLAAIATALSIYMGLDRPSLTSKVEANGKKILIYGGSSSAGGLATAYATAAGYEVVTTSSPKNKGFVQSLGPSTIIDHTQPAKDVLSKIKSNGPYEAIFDTIGLPDVTEVLAEYLTSIGGGSYNSLLAPDGPMPANVQRKFAPYSLSMDKPENAEFRTWFYSELVPKGLGTGIIVPTRPQWINGGLDQAQKALDLMMEGKVSGKKLLMDPSA